MHGPLHGHGEGEATQVTGSTIDGFLPEHNQAFEAFSEKAAERVFGYVDRLARRFHVRVEGLDNLPEGRGLLVANHAFGWDVVFAMAAIWRERRRRVWVLGEHLWWQVPFVRRIAASVGTVDGTPENVDRLLEREELVLVLPGGLREAVKPRGLRYRLLWGRRYGFVRAAIRNRAPMVPLASVGADDWFDFVGNAYVRGESWLHLKGIPVPLPSRILPIPHLVPLHFVVGEPIVPRFSPERHDDRAALRSMRREIEGALHELFEDELARRDGIELG